MTTINNYSVGLSLDASKYIRNSSLSRAETSKLKREINSARTPADRYKQSLNLLEKSLKQGAISQGTFAKLAEAAQAKYTKSSQSLGANNARLSEARRLTESLTTPQERYNKALSSAIRLHRDGLISRETMLRQYKSLKVELASATGAERRHADTMARARQITLSMRTPLEVYAAKLREINKLRKVGAISARTHSRAMANARSELNSVGKSSKEGAAGMGLLATRLGAAGLAFAAFYKTAGAASDGLKLAAQTEQLGITFEVLTKDAEVSARLISQLRSFAAATPFRQKEIMQGAKNLLAFGLSASSVLGEVRKLGNISAATGIRIEELTQIIGKMRTQQKIYSEDLNQLTGRGINVLDGLAERLGTTSAKVKKFASEGKIDFEDLKAVLDDLATNDFGGMLERQSKSILGQWSTFNDELEKTRRILGEIAMDSGGRSTLGFLGRQVVQFNKGLDFLRGSPELLAKQRESNEAATAAGERLRQIRNGGSLAEIEQRVRSRQLAGFAGRGQGFQNLAGDMLGTQAAGVKGAAQGLMGGFQQLGQTIMQGFQYNATTIRKAIVVEGPAASLEVGSQEAYQFLTSSTDAALKEERRRAQKAEQQRKAQIDAQRRGNSLLADLMAKMTPVQRKR